MHIQAIPMFADNYAYLLVDEDSRDAAIIDPSQPSTVAPILQSKIDANDINLTAIINTHHHNDHAGGNNELRAILGRPNLRIFGGVQCQAVDHIPKNNETILLGTNVQLTALHTPCHTQDSICWYVRDLTPGKAEQRAVFTGDTLFIGGCGRFFEGSATEMHHALNEVLATLPNDTRIYTGHEYTKTNARFAQSIVKTPEIDALADFAENNKVTQGCYTMEEEKKHNVFMMANHGQVMSTLGETEPVEVMKRLRSMKDKFR
ncbi:hydroxyacylglutathione hydrolase [Ceratocystis lukuohia]|uniref:hydroxyacylglutathione hydrolase n=2 Tax=Ceratocystis TaxID=5157 RepID=A0A2C5WXH7_9PEZI|nr:putative hydroxyacylglutathione hydrolase [Ceratocystis fimbriata CBS 114723]